MQTRENFRGSKFVQMWIEAVSIRRRFLSPVKCRHEHNMVVLLYLVLVLTLQFPICFVDED
jgi:hypothetical protein